MNAGDYLARREEPPGGVDVAPTRRRFVIAIASDVNHQVFREWIKLVKPLPMPANARVVEMFETVNAGLRELYLGKQAPRQAISDLHLQLQRVLDQ